MKSSWVSGWEVLVGSKDRVIVVSASHLKEEDVFRDSNIRNRESRRDISTDNDKVELND